MCETLSQSLARRAGIFTRWKHVNRPLRKGYYDRFVGALPKRAIIDFRIVVFRCLDTDLGFMGQQS